MTVARNGGGNRVSAGFLVSHPAHFIALGFGAGLAPFAPGTFGTLAAIPIAFLLWRTGSSLLFVAVVVWLAIAGAWAAARTGRDLGRDDDGAIVIDEIAAFLAMLFFVGEGTMRIVFAFALFRLLDVLKPPPIGWLDAHVKGGAGVIVDDFAAAGLALVVYAIVVRATGWPA